MKSAFLISGLFIFISQASFSQNWTWMRGAAINGTITGVYGTQGVASSSNDPGTRHGAATWVDASGNLWMFGGDGISSTPSLSILSDMWKYNISTNEWTWVRGSNQPTQVANYGTQGVAASTNEPGAREFCVTWTDASGNFWLFGGEGVTTNSTVGMLSDLWKYDPIANMWTWMKGPNTIDQFGTYGTIGVTASTNLPGARYGASGFADASGNLYLFAGRGFPASGFSGFLNDLWRYNIATNNWTWINGTNLQGQHGVYGTMNTPSGSNTPGGREFPAYWKDLTGDFIVCGGRGFASAGGPAYLNDLWRYDIASNTWTWINGSNLVNPLGIYGTAGVSSPSVRPGGRLSTASWIDQAGNLYMFGGLGWNINSAVRLNDLFKYDFSNNQWTFLKGDSAVSQKGTYGTMGVPAASNVPGGRELNSWWTSPGNGFWLHGGRGWDSTGVTLDNMNDLWRYDPPCSPDSILANISPTLCSGNSVTLTAFNQYPSNVVWYNVPTGGAAVANGSVFVTSPLTAISTSSVLNYYAEANTCTTSPRAMISVTVHPLPVISISGQTVACSGSSITLTASGATSYSWVTGTTGPTATVSCSAGQLIVLGANNFGCENSSNFTVTCMPSPSIQVIATHSLVCRGLSTTITASGANSYLWNNTMTTPAITVTPVSTTPYTVTGTNTNGCSNSVVFTQSVSLCAGVNETRMEKNVNVYPNPSAGQVNLTLAGIHELISFEVYNQLGQIFFVEQNIKGSENFELNIPKGIYFYRVTMLGQAIATGKLVIN